MNLWKQHNIDLYKEVQTDDGMGSFISKITIIQSNTPCSIQFNDSGSSALSGKLNINNILIENKVGEIFIKASNLDINLENNDDLYIVFNDKIYRILLVVQKLSGYKNKHYILKFLPEPVDKEFI